MSTLTSSDAASAWAKAPGGIRLRVRLTPKSSKDTLEGCARLADETVVLRAKVRAVPEDGKANTALIRLLARELGVAASDISLESGATGRTKTLFIAGDPDGIGRALAAIG